jgi:hypothetical protein
MWGTLSDKRTDLSFKLQLVLASADFLGFESRRTHDQILLSQIPPTWGARSLYLYPPGTGWPSYTPRHSVPVSSPPRTRRATVEVFDPSYTWVSRPTVKVKVTLRLAVYRQLVRHGVKPLETHDQRFFQLNPCGNRPYATYSLTRRWVCLL